MSLSKIKGFFSRHRNKFIVGGLLVTGSVLLSKFLQQKLKEYQEKELMEFLERTRKQQHFETINRTCNQTVLNLSSSMYETLSKIIDTDRLIAELRTNPEERIAIWNNLKVLLFAKLCCFIYATAMLVVTLRMQLNIVGGHLFKDPNSIDATLQEKYLGTVQTLINKGLTSLAVETIKASRKLVENIDMKKQMRLSDIDALFWSLQNSINNEERTIENLKSYILIDHSDESLDSIIRDTADLLESQEVKSLVSQCVSKGFSHFADEMAEYYNKNDMLAENDVDFDTRKPLAKLLPIINGLLTKNSFPDKFVQRLVVNEKLQIFGANVYESYL